MSRDDIIRMAREAGFKPHHSPEMWDITIASDEAIERFAHLVYEATFRDANIAASRTILDAAVLEEREACAKTVEIFDKTFQTGGGIAGSIRARSNP